jgi:alkyldihydroxyacetonephosphate synthase
MKWWGWGDENVTFSHEGKPELAPFIERVLGLHVSRPGTPAIAFQELDIPPPVVPAGLRADLEAAVGAEQVSSGDHDRVVHGRGKSLTDLVRQRRGDLGRLPDVVVRPGGEEEVVALVRAALEADAVLIPFGAGSSISGSLEAEPGETRPVISVDMARMNRVLSIDATSQLARVQAGVFGPDLERQLNAQGWTCGHFPDSFTYSTLGGWIATRSSGMQSDRYGDVAELTRGLRVVTPSGVLVVRPVPSTSTGPSVREMVLGSEGRLGIITEATIHVRRVPPERKILGYLFPGWADGLAAMRDIAASEAEPSVTRVSDAYETAFSFATRTDPTLLDRVKSKALQAFLKRKGWDLEAMCLSFIGYEGSADHVAAQRKLTERIVKRHGGLCIGTSPGELYDQKKFDTPYIRDFLLDRGAPADVSETSAPWGELQTVYDNVMAAGHGAFHQLGVPGYLMCHLSHSYHAGACLYFTFALNPPAGRDALEDYGVVKRAIQQAFVDSGATLSHHHAVGTEHAQWLEEDISTPGVAMLRALFDGTDPGANLNPGKIVAAGAHRARGETVPAGESSRTNGGTGGPRRSLDAQRGSQPRS